MMPIFRETNGKSKHELKNEILIKKKPVKR